MENEKKALNPIKGLVIGNKVFNIINYTAGTEEIADGSPLETGTFYYKYEDDLDDLREDS